MVSVNCQLNGDKPLDMPVGTALILLRREDLFTVGGAIPWLES